MKLLIIIFLTSIFCFNANLHAEVIERIVAVVNSEIITLSDLNLYREKIKKGGLVDDALLKLSNPKKIISDQKALIDHLISERIVDSEIKKLGIQVTMEQVEKEIRSIAEKNGIGREQLIMALKNQGVDFSEYQDFLRTTLERQNLIEREITSKIKISDGEISEYYLKNSDKKVDNRQYFEYEIAHVLFLKKNGGEAAAESRAIEVYQQLQQGKDFSELASKFSEDPNFTQGGLLGIFKVNEMNSSLAKSVMQLEPGQHSKVLLAPGNNYQIVKVNKKKLIPNPHLDAEKPRIHAVLFERAFKLQLSTWLERRRQEAFIKINI